MTKTNGLAEETERMMQKLKKAHKGDVEYVQQNHPELATFLTEHAEAFGKVNVIYRSTLRWKST